MAPADRDGLWRGGQCLGRRRRGPAAGLEGPHRGEAFDAGHQERGRGAGLCARHVPLGAAARAAVLAGAGHAGRGRLASRQPCPAVAAESSGGRLAEPVAWAPRARPPDRSRRAANAGRTARTFERQPDRDAPARRGWSDHRGTRRFAEPGDRRRAVPLRPVLVGGPRGRPPLEDSPRLAWCPSGRWHDCRA